MVIATTEGELLYFKSFELLSSIVIVDARIELAF